MATMEEQLDAMYDALCGTLDKPGLREKIDRQTDAIDALTKQVGTNTDRLDGHETKIEALEKAPSFAAVLNAVPPWARMPTLMLLAVLISGGSLAGFVQTVAANPDDVGAAIVAYSQEVEERRAAEAAEAAAAAEALKREREAADRAASAVVEQVNDVLPE